jgi:hypothetical protein
MQTKLRFSAWSKLEDLELRISGAATMGSSCSPAPRPRNKHRKSEHEGHKGKQQGQENIEFC